MSTSIEAIIFDCDGTLVDSESMHWAALELVLQPFNIDISSRDLRAEFAGVDNAAVLKELTTRFRMTFPADIESRLAAASLKLCETMAVPMPCARELLIHLDHRRTRLAVASNSRGDVVDALLTHCGFRDYFGHRIASRDRVSAPKPAPDVYLLAARLCDAEPSRCLAIEDSSAGVAAARAAGMLTIGYSAPSMGPERFELLRAGAHFLINDLKSLNYLLGPTL